MASVHCVGRSCDMDVRICSFCGKFQCRLVDKRNYIGDGFSMRNFLIIVSCGEKIVCIEPVGKAQIITDNVLFLSRETNITNEMLPEDMKEDYSRAIDNVVEKIVNSKVCEKCEYMSEQLLSEWNGEQQ